jgi:pimeloyl-ACP methyl ester carboxylesterase
MRQVFSCALLVLLLAVGLAAQNLVGFKRSGTMPVAETNRMIAKAFGGAVRPTGEALDLYKITYRSRDEKNRPVVLSGLVVFPKGGAPNGLVVFNHGTLVSSALAPSRFTGKANKSEAQTATLAFASGGYAVVMPDYLGLGDHQGAHPYPLGAANSRAAVDIIAPARALAKRLNLNLSPRLFVSGYSEGGAVAMWTVRDLEAKSGPDYNVEAAALGSGPYDLSDVTRRWILAEPTSQEQFVIRLYLTSYMISYFHDSAGVKIVDYFKPAMALTIDRAYKANISDENIIKRLALAAVLMRSKNSLANVITPRFKRVLETLDRKDPVIRELVKSDVYDWSPRTKMLLINLVDDQVVDPGNTAKAIQTMRRRGVGPDILRQHVIEDRQLNHITGMPAAMAEARRFFDAGFRD